MRYVEREPPAVLRRQVRCFWSYEAGSEAGAVQAVVPDGCAELILHLAEPYAELSESLKTS